MTKTKFWSRGLGGGSAGRYLIAQSRPVLLTKNALRIRTGVQAGADADTSSRDIFCTKIEIACICRDERRNRGTFGYQKIS